MTALAHTSESDCRTRTTSEHCTANESWTRTKCAYAAPDKNNTPMNPNSERIEKSLRIFSPLSDYVPLPWPWLAAPDNLLFGEFPCEPGCLAGLKLFHTREIV